MKLSQMRPRKAMEAIAAIVPYVKEIKDNPVVSKILDAKGSLKEMDASAAIDLLIDAVPAVCVDSYEPLARIIAFLCDTTFEKLDSGSFEEFIKMAKSVRDSSVVQLFTSSTSSAQGKSSK